MQIHFMFSLAFAIQEDQRLNLYSRELDFTGVHIL